LGLENSTDLEIWNYAKNNDFAIVSFDADFVDLASMKGIPPKIIWMRTGNMPTDALSKLLNKNEHNISDFISNEEFSDLEVLEVLEI